MSAGRCGSSVVTSWNSSKNITSWRLRSAASSAGSSSSRSIVASMSLEPREAENEKRTEPSRSKLTVGTTRRPLKKRSASFAFISDDATSSWTDFASFAANRSFVGVVIRSTSTTSTPSPTSRLSAALTSDDFP